MKISKKGDVPIPYIIALILGIAIVAVIGYWFFVLSGLWGVQVSLENCQTRAHTYCSGWQLSGYGIRDVMCADNPDTPEDESKNVCDTKPTVGWFEDQGDNSKCAPYLSTLGFSGKTSATTDKAACQTILGGGGGGGGGTPTTRNPAEVP